MFESVEAKDRAGLAEYRNAYTPRMQAAARAEIAIPAVTCLHRGTGRGFGRADVSIFDRLRGGLARRAIRPMAIFGTRFVIESDLFERLREYLDRAPLPDEIYVTHTNYVDLAAAGKGSPEKRD